ncbi:MAG: D-glycerate dehydrogenase [candidate division NC10 bacterium]|nr:D-glycerate dehydrogenase [candidate division NC10 bacterium]
MSRSTVYVSRSVRPSVLARLGEACETRAWAGTGRCPAEVLEKEIGDVAAVLGTDRWTAELMDKASHLRIIALTAVGFDSVDVTAATERGIIVTNTAGSLTDTVADLVFALMLTVARRVSESERWLRAGNWRSVGVTPMGRDVHHTTLGILGMGRIGATVADRARGFQMRVLYHDTVRREELEKQHGYRFVTLDTLLRESDFISLHTALTPETRGMIGESELAKMKPTAFLINTSRGPVVNEGALIAALRAGRPAGAGLDVFETEPIGLENPLLKMENVVILPHVGSATEATRQAMVDLATDNVLAVLQGRPPLTPVNPEVLSQLKR